MSAIGLDILKIGSSKWSQDVEMNLTSGMENGAPSHFMLPAAENVCIINLNCGAIIDHKIYSCFGASLFRLYSLRSSAEPILMLKRVKTTTKKSNL